MPDPPGLYDAHMHSSHSPGFAVIPDRTVLSCAAAPEDWDALLTETRREIRIFLGLHPEALPSDLSELSGRLEELSDHLHKCPRAGVGECGLDRRFYKTHPREMQERALRFQIRLAGKLWRPLNLHQVRAAGALAEVLEEERPEVPVIIHGFKEKKETAERFLRLGAFLSFGPGQHWQDHSFLSLFRSIPREQILMESDWPYNRISTNRNRTAAGFSDSAPENSYAELMNRHYDTASAALGIDKEELRTLVKRNGTVFTD